MRQNGVKYRFMHEIDAKGWRKVLKEVLAEVKAMKIDNVFLSLDTDVLDMAYAPGMGTPEPGGLTSAQMMTMIRGLAIQNEVIMIDFVEYTPLLDDRHYNTGLMINRMMRVMLAGMAARKKGITDPDYIAPIMLEHK